MIEDPVKSSVEGSYSIERHGDGWALYIGRSDSFHGYRLCNLDDFDATGDITRRLIVDALESHTRSVPVMCAVVPLVRRRTVVED